MQSSKLIRSENNCFTCGLHGHYSRNCPNKQGNINNYAFQNRHYTSQNGSVHKTHKWQEKKVQCWNCGLYGHKAAMCRVQSRQTYAVINSKSHERKKSTTKHFDQKSASKICKTKQQCKSQNVNPKAKVGKSDKTSAISIQKGEKSKDQPVASVNGVSVNLIMNKKSCGKTIRPNLQVQYERSMPPGKQKSPQLTTEGRKFDGYRMHDTVGTVT